MNSALSLALPVLVLSLPLGCALNIDDDFTDFGQACDVDDDCGDGLACVGGVCGGDVAEGEGEGEGEEGEGEGDIGDCDSPTVVFEGSAVADDGGADGLPANVQVITGDVRISARGALTGLAGLCEIQGSLEIVDATNLVNVQLAQLRHVGGNVDLRGNVGMRTLDLSSLATVDGDLLIGDLVPLSPGEGDCPAGNDFDCASFVGNDDLETVDLDGLDSVGGAVRVVGNENLEEITLPMSTVTNEIMVIRNSGLLNLSLPDLTSCSDLFLIEDNISLASISAPALVSVEVGSGALSPVVQGFYDFMSRGALWIWTSQLQGVDGSFTYQLPTSLDFTNLQTVGGTLNLSEILAQTVEFPALTSIADLTVRDNYVEDTGMQTLRLPQLTTLTTARSDDGLFISDNRFLDTLELPLLADANAVDLRDLPVLSNLCGFSGLRTVGRLQIAENDRLASLDGLGGLTDVSGIYTVTNNPQLPQCQVTALQTQTTPGTTNAITGNNNGATCDDPPIDAVCGG